MSKAKKYDLQILMRLLGYLKSRKALFFFAVFLTISIALLSPLRPYLIQRAVDDYVSVKDVQGLKNITLIMVAILFIEAIFNFSYSFYANVLAQSVIKEIRSEVYESILSYRLKFYDRSAVGSLVTRVVSDVEAIASVFSQGLLTVIGDLLKLTVVIVVMFWVSWKLTLACLCTLPFLIVGSYWFKRTLKKAYQKVRKEVSELNTFVQERITGMQIVQLFNREEQELQAFKEINLRHRQANIDSIWAYSVFFPLVEILLAGSMAMLIWVGATGVIEHYVTFGQLMAFILYINMLFRPIRHIADNINVLQMGIVAAGRVFNVVGLNQTERIEDLGKEVLDDFKGDLEFKHVSFAYHEPHWVLKDLSFRLSDAQTLAVVGPTGAGKSSLINILARFYEYQKGQILLSGKSLEQIRLTSLYKHVLVVTQEVFLFSDTIYNNIVMGDQTISLQKVQQAAKAIGADDFIKQLPEEYDYNVRERGVMLSVGQRQLIAFIRAYVHNPKLLILDEATSSVDAQTEELIQKAIEVLTKGRTSIVIAHRLSTIKSADKILVLQDGEIIQQGDHKSLLTEQGLYKDLHEVQFSKPSI